MRTKEEVIQRLGTITESLKVEDEKTALAKIAAIRELEWVLGIREK
jgi:hypothetical protein